jgi:hypothetical protein
MLKCYLKYFKNNYNNTSVVPRIDFIACPHPFLLRLSVVTFVSLMCFPSRLDGPRLDQKPVCRGTLVCHFVVTYEV